VEPLTVVGGVPAKLLKKIDVNDTQQTFES
jgi:acetyltransferase-like isoleucine patch superfamily enzyme